MPATTSALADGALSPQHVDLLAGAAAGGRRGLFEAHEELLVDQCRTLRFADASRAVAYWMQRADAEATELEGDRLHESRQASAATTFDGMVDLRRPARSRRRRDVPRRAGQVDGAAPTPGPRRRRRPDGDAASRRRPRRDVPPIEVGQRGRRHGPDRSSPCSWARRRWLGSASCRLARSSPRARSCRCCMTPTSSESCSTVRTGSCPSLVDGASSAHCAERSRFATAAANTRRAATNRPRVATSTTSSRGSTVVRRPRRTDGCTAGATTEMLASAMPCRRMPTSDSTTRTARPLTVRPRRNPTAAPHRLRPDHRTCPADHASSWTRSVRISAYRATR